MVDNRDLIDDFDESNYVSLAVCINYLYSKKHGYDFLYYKTKNMNEIENTKNAAVAFNYKLKQYRGAPWAKIPASFNASKKKYDRIVYIDSDCVFRNFSLSVDDFLKKTKNIQGKVEDKDVVFLNNKPWNENRPCSGFYVIKPSSVTQNFLKVWWNYPNEKYNFRHDYEQRSLFHIFKDFDEIIEIKDQWMFKPALNQYLRHIGSHEGEKRVPTFKKFLIDLLNVSKDTFKEVIENVPAIEYSTSTDCKNLN
jgi:hypothetical protein